MQTKKQITELLESAGTYPKHNFGQNFLIDRNLINLITETACLTKQDVVLEVGCGTGSLTADLAQQARDVIAVEIDNDLFAIASDQLQTFENITLLNCNIIEKKHNITPEVAQIIKTKTTQSQGKLLLVANLPYNIASPLMLSLTTVSPFADAMHITIQKEVAYRMTAEPDTEYYGILSIALNAIGDTEIVRIIGPESFWPKPKVDSAIVSFTNNSEKRQKIQNIDLFLQIVRFFMQHKRKMLKSTIKSATGPLAQLKDYPEILKDAKIDPALRPQSVKIDQFVTLSNLFSKKA